jgi:hypothetical protein
MLWKRNLGLEIVAIHPDSGGAPAEINNMTVVILAARDRLWSFPVIGGRSLAGFKLLQANESSYRAWHHGDPPCPGW